MYVSKTFHYVHLLTDKRTSAHQMKCLLVTANEDQMNAISEIIYNIYSYNIKLDTKTQKKVRQVYNLLETISNISVSYKRRLTLLRNNLKPISKLISIVSTQIRKAIVSIEKNKNGSK